MAKSNQAKKTLPIMVQPTSGFLVSEVTKYQPETGNETDAIILIAKDACSYQGVVQEFVRNSDGSVSFREEQHFD